MEYIKNSDYEYIRKNKYHNSTSIDGSDRFIRRDEIFDPETGMDGDKIKEGILLEDEKIKDLPHPIRKARGMEFVLKNTRISCDPRDIFPAINTVDRPITDTLIAMWKNEVFTDIIPEVDKKRKAFEQKAIVTIWPDYCHSAPIWERILGLGFSGLLEDSEKARASKEWNPDEEAFFEGIKITYTAIIDFIGRLYDLASKTKGSEKMAKALKNIKAEPPKTFYEALLVNYLYFMISEHVEYLQVRSLSNFDRIYYPYWKNDIESGRTEEELREELAYFLLQFTSIGNYWNQPVFLGGSKENDDTEINELSYAFLDVYDKMGLYNPKIQIKIADNIPADFTKKALDMIRRGNSSIVFVSDATIRKALVKAGSTEEEARLCNITGCFEYQEQGGFASMMNYFNLLKPLEYALHKGCDGISGEFCGLECPAPSSYNTFEELYAEYKRQLLYVIDETVDIVNGFEEYMAYIDPLSILSATFPSCLERGKDAIGGGATKNMSYILFGFIADVADSLAMIKKYVFDKKEFSLAELVDILDKNFEGHEDVRKKLLSDRDKYGNNKDLPDYFASDLPNYIAENLCGRPNAKIRGGEWNFGFHVARMSYIQADRTAASANGRKMGEELSKNVSASMGQNREGATAAVLSATKIDATRFTSDAPLDLGLLPSAVKGDDGLEAMYGLLKAFIALGGHAMQINVFSADMLRDAQRNPEKYKDLQIRVCGWNVLWNNINKEEQDGFIRQAESLV